MISKRFAVAAGVATTWGFYVWFAAHRNPALITDFDQLWWAARVLRGSEDPYTAIGPGRVVDLYFPFYYPLTAAVLAWPLSWADIVTARVIWVAFPTGLLCYLVTREGYHQLPMFLSGAMMACAHNAQWAPLLMCGLYLPAVGGVFAGKPNVGAAIVVGQESWRAAAYAVGGALALLVISLVMLPGWPASWLTAVRSGEHFAPYILRPFGALLLLAGLRWRDPAARVLLALAVVPHTALVYDTLLAFTAARTLRHSLVLAILTHVANVVAALRGDPDGTFAAYVSVSAGAALALVYLPALWMIVGSPQSRRTLEVVGGEHHP